jgi:ABC-type Fe3+-hydroxamate transport system substrate-binding protein
VFPRPRNASATRPHAARRGARVAVSIAAVAAALAACGADPRAAATADEASAARDGAAPPTVVATDDFGHPVAEARRAGRDPAARIVSLDPAATELVFALGADSRLVGRSRWDGRPDAVRRVPDVGDGIRPNVEAVLAARPTLVLLYATQENRAAAEAFRRAGVATLATRVDRLQQFRAFTRTLGDVLGTEAAATRIVDSVDATLARVREAVRGAPTVRVAWPLWSSPLLVVGGGSYLDELITLAGGRNVFGDLDAPSPQVSVEDVARRDPALLLAGPAGAATLREAAGWRAVRAVREGRIALVDTGAVGRPSVNLGMAAVSLARLLHPERAAALP